MLICCCFFLRKSPALQHASFQPVEVRDSSKDEEYWESMGNVISEDKIKLWDDAEISMKDYLWVTNHTHNANILLYSNEFLKTFFFFCVYSEVLTEIAVLVPETQSLEQQNAELRMLLQQSLTSSVRVCLWCRSRYSHSWSTFLTIV